MKTKKVKNRSDLFSLYCLSFIAQYLKCIIVKAQMEKIAIDNIKQKNNLSSQKLLRLNLKHNRLVKSLYDKKMKIECCA